jgi:hypothetical protein
LTEWLLSYKSIQLAIQELEKTGDLRPFVPESRKPPRRRLYLAKPAMQDYDNLSSATNVLVGKGYIKAALTRWTLGDRIYSSNGAKGGFLKDLDPPPPEVWEIRVTEPVAQARLFGRFAAPDTIVLTKFYTRRLLGNKRSPEWSRAVAQCVNCWNSLFGDLPPFAAKTISEYVTENCDDFPIR